MPRREPPVNCDTCGRLCYTVGRTKSFDSTAWANEATGGVICGRCYNLQGGDAGPAATGEVKEETRCTE